MIITEDAKVVRAKDPPLHSIRIDSKVRASNLWIDGLEDSLDIKKLFKAT
jgi:hypothetical protein